MLKLSQRFNFARQELLPLCRQEQSQLHFVLPVMYLVESSLSVGNVQLLRRFLLSSATSESLQRQVVDYCLDYYVANIAKVTLKVFDFLVSFV